ncbi:hypothetical protein [Hyperthermus butylicus]|uniref:hypothetical protein n=1 Tax=Hyperthermus butylicus TaxID=54248 RepID=UPI00129AA8AF|nr:hypothetical protein [Hyperthermus butylicus]
MSFRLRRLLRRLKGGKVARNADVSATFMAEASRKQRGYELELPLTVAALYNTATR